LIYKNRHVGDGEQIKKLFTIVGTFLFSFLLGLDHNGVRAGQGLDKGTNETHHSWALTE
jgi:hypothetical protein